MPEDYVVRYVYTGEYGMEVEIGENIRTGKFHAILRDADADQPVSGGTRICISLEQAEAYAQEMLPHMILIKPW